MVAGCNQKMGEGLTFVRNQILTCYGYLMLTKAPFWIYGYMSDTRGSIKSNLLLF